MRFVKFWFVNFLFLVFFFTVNAQVIQSNFDSKPYVEGEFLIQLADENSLDKILIAAPEGYKLMKMDYLSPPMRIWLVRFDPLFINANDMQDWLYRQPNVTAVDYNYFIDLREGVQPDDPNFLQQWHHVNTGQTGGTVDADIDSDLAWEITTGGQTATNDDIVVCMIESGNLDHPDLSPNRWVNIHEIPDNGIDDDGNGYIDDYNGWNPFTNTDDYGSDAHGTNCLGMIGAKGNNELNVSGINWDVKLMVIGDYSTNTQASVIRAYTYPLVMRKLWNESNGERGAFVVATSSSWGIDQGNPLNYPLWCQFYDTLGYHGILNIGATSNSNVNVDVVGDMPTACSSDYIIGVGRTDHNDNTAGGYGVSTIYFGAPGINVVTTNGSSGITTTTGTSFSCPLTAGVVGLAYSIPCTNFMSIVKSNPRRGADLVRDALLNGVDVKAQLQSRFITGGRLNARNTLDLLMESTCSACVARAIEVNAADNSAVISFENHADEDLITLQYRIVGDETWQNMTATTLPLTIQNLTSCRTYEFFITTECGEEIVSTNVNYFTTSGCGSCFEEDYCVPQVKSALSARLSVVLPDLSHQTITNFVETDNWGASLTANYNYAPFALMRGSGNVPNEGCGTIVNPGDLVGKIAVCLRGTCNYTIKAINAQNAGAVALVIVNTSGALSTLGGGTNGRLVNIPVIMIQANVIPNLITNLESGAAYMALLGGQKEWISAFQINGQTFSSGDDDGYKAPFVGPSISLRKEQLYAFSVNISFGNQVLPERINAYIDFNQDGLFSTDEIVYQQADATTTTRVDGAFTIPNYALDGSTRLRLQMIYEGVGQTNIPSACENYSWGEVEDYCLAINEELSTHLLDSDLVEVFPNPAKNFFDVQLSSSLIGSDFELIDILGRSLVRENLNALRTRVRVENFSNGSYYYRVIDKVNGLVFTGKIVIH